LKTNLPALFLEKAFSLILSIFFPVSGFCDLKSEKNPFVGKKGTFFLEIGHIGCFFLIHNIVQYQNIYSHESNKKTCPLSNICMRYVLWINCKEGMDTNFFLEYSSYMMQVLLFWTVFD
jgi:hypothetical protein